MDYLQTGVLSGFSSGASEGAPGCVSSVSWEESPAGLNEQPVKARITANNMQMNMNESFLISYLSPNLIVFDSSLPNHTYALGKVAFECMSVAFRLFLWHIHLLYCHR